MHKTSFAKTLLLSITLAIAPVAYSQFVAFNDHAPGPGTAPNTTSFSADPSITPPATNGPLKEITSGVVLPAIVNVSAQGNVTWEGNQGNPAPGTPLYTNFNGFVDFQGTPNPSIAINGAGAYLTYTFSGLNPAKRYSFRGGAVRANGYIDRWTLMEITGANSFISAHTVNAITSTQVPALAANQAVFNFGSNDSPISGDMADWENIDPGADGTFSIVSTHYQGTIPGGSSAGAKAYGPTGIRLEEFNLVPVGAAITNQPQNQIVTELQTAVFTVGARGNPPPAYQWFRDNSPIPDGTNSTYTIASAQLTDSGASFKVAVSNTTNGVLNTVTSTSVTLTVNADNTAPTLLRAGSSSEIAVLVTFSEPITELAGTNVNNYAITGTNGPVSVLAAALQSNGSNVVLTTTTLGGGANYTLTVNGIRDRSAAGNLIAANSSTVFNTAAGFVGADIGATGVAGSVAAVTGGFDVSGGGADIGGAADQLTFGYQQRSGDFDVRARVAGLTPTDVWAKAGLMARQTLNANSAYAAALSSPGLAGAFLQSRATAGGATTSSGNQPVNYPYTWLRLQRVGSLFTGYISLDGSAWVQLGSASVAMSDPVYFGLAVSSHTNGIAAAAQFRDIGATVGASVIPALNSPVEPPGPSSRKTGVAITEIMYKPGPREDGRNTEFVEIYNSNPYFEDISGYRIAGDIDYTFPPNTILPGGAYLVIARVPADMQAAYGIANVVGPYTGTLKTSGTIRLRNQVGAILLEVPYSSKPPWPVAATGTGHSIVMARPSYGEGYPQAWAISDSFGGSPGRFDGFSFDPARAVVINEFLAQSDTFGNEYIELYNHGNQPVNLSGASLSDDQGTNKFFLNGVIIPARGFRAFTEAELGFSLNADGETIYLVNSNNTRVLDAVAYEPQAKNISSGRFPDGAPAFYPLVSSTPGAQNTQFRVHDIVINEIMYSPISEDSNDEFVEIYNKGTSANDLSGWKFTDGIDFTFPPNTIVAPDGYLVVAKNKTNLLAHYPNLNNANTVGDYAGTLKNGGERLALSYPEVHQRTNDLGVAVSNTVYAVADEVTYVKGGRWGSWSAGGGSSLELIDARSNHRLPSNWADSDETAKSTWTTIEGAGMLDFGAPQDGQINRLELITLGEGECLVDNVEVLNNTGANMLATGNQNFEAGIGNWTPQGNHIQSSIEGNEGFGSARSLHVRATGRGDTGANRIRVALTGAMTANSTGTIRAKVRWLRGWPELVLRLKGNSLEATGRMNVPQNLGTPGARNSRAVANAGPAIYQVSHSPVVPAANAPVLVTARVHDFDGVNSLILQFRVDPVATYATTNMVDDGTKGDAIAGDGIFSATIPGQPANSLVAFSIKAVDDGTPAVTNIFPPGASATAGQECLVRFGDPASATSYATYRFWMTQNNVNTWINRPSMSNERVEGTFVYGNYRAIYNISGKYSGSPYHQGFSSPVVNSCHYSLEIPADDLLLGTDNFNKIHAPGNGAWDDATIQREQAGYWLARQLNLPWNYRRYVNFIFNGNRRSPNSLMEDTQVPGGGVIESIFPDDQDGSLYKLQPWFEFDDVTVTGSGSAPFGNQSWCVMNQFISGGVKKLARYRHNYLARAVKGSANDYQDVFNLVDAASNTGTAFVQAMDAIVDTEEWLRIFAVGHAVGNWDSFGNRNSQNMYGYKPTQGRWTLMIWDLNILFGNSGSDGPGAALFQYQTADNNMGKMYSTPIYRRAYWRSLKEIAAVHMPNPQFFDMLDAKYNSFIASGLTGISSPQPIKDYANAARASILSQLAAEDSGTFTVNGNSVITVSNNLVTFTGTAPVDAKTLRVNGIEYPITWTGVASWTMTIAVPTGNSSLVFEGYDLKGNPIAGFSTTVSVTYNGPVVLPRDALVINEVMYHPAVSNASYVEIFNSSPLVSFDISGWRLSGLDYTFPPGTIITNRQFIVLAKNRMAFAATYGAAIPVFAEFDGNLDPEGEKLALIKPGPAAAQDQVIDAVRYEAAAPWPAAADGGGAAFQLIDPSQDHTRVANWSDGSGWRFHSFTGIPGAGGTSFTVTLGGAGDFYIDDITLVAGNTPAVGPNLFQNGGFETGSLSPWTVSGNHSGSTVSSAVKFSGNSSLRLVATGAGSVSGNALAQAVSGVAAAGTYTLSFWYLPSTSPADFNYRLTSNFRSTTAVSLRPSLSSPGAPNTTAASIEAFPSIWINEVEPNNVLGVTDNAGQHDPWLEIYNSGATAINLDGYALSKSYANPGQWPFPNDAVINPGEYKVVFADADVGQTLGNELHTNFRLDPASGSIVLSKNGRILDYINYTNMDANFSYGSFPDGQVVDQQRFFYTTPGAPNNGAPVPVIINEWMAANTTGITNPVTGRFDDWIELYNFGPVAVDLSGFYLTDDTAQKKQSSLPPGTIIGPGGYLFIWADNTTNSTPSDLHVNFALSRTGEKIALYTPDLLLVDLVTFGAQQNNQSQGRYPNGNFAGVLYFMTNATPNGANVVPPNQSAPLLPGISDRSINEGSLLTFTNLATDADVPIQTLTYSLDAGAPFGASINPITGVFNWTPTEVQGGSAYNITVRVSDNGDPTYMASRTFVATVNKLNSPPSVSPLPSRTLPENATVAFTVTASDSDLPIQNLTFSLDADAPEGATIDPVTGQFSWTPNEAQGPATNIILVRVTDNGVPSASATQAVTITVTEVNTPPTLDNPGTQTIDETKLWTYQLIASDSDLPTNRLTFATVAPFVSGVTINSGTGIISWTPTEAQGAGTYVMKVRVIDNASPSLSATQTFTVIVNEINNAPVLNNLNNATRTIAELTSITLTNRATDQDTNSGPLNVLTYELVSGPDGATVNPTTGVFGWTPSEAQGPSSNSILVRVFDDGVPSLSATQRFSVVVTEVNLAPVFPPIPNKNVNVGQLLSFTNVVNDPDLPAQTLTFSFVSGAPSGATLDATSGVFSWTPAATGTNTVAIRVVDNGTPALSATQSVTIVVSSVIRITGIQLVSPTALSIAFESQNGKDYELRYTDDLEQPTANWAVLPGSQVRATSSSQSIPVTISSGVAARFYRVVQTN